VSKSVVVVSLEVVGKTMAGPGIRAYNFARELARAHEVTLVAPNRDAEVEADFEVVGRRSLSLRAYTGLLREADVVVAQHLPVELMHYLARLDTRTVYDLYVPFATENLGLHATQGARPAYRRLAYRSGNLLQQAALATGNAFVCASERQRDLWLGGLAATGRLELELYRSDASLRGLIDVVPFGLEPHGAAQRVPVLKGVVDGIRKTDRVLLWGGGIWNWFDPLTVIEAVAELARRRDDVKLFFLGVRHPNPAVEEMSMTRRAIELARSLGVLDRFVFFNEGWVPYEERQAYFAEADLGVSAHFDSVETRFAFRTRFLDHFAAALPTVATGGDVLGDLVGERGLGAVVDSEDVEGWADAIAGLLDDGERYARARDATLAVRDEFAWPRVTRPLVRLVDAEGGKIQPSRGTTRMVAARLALAGGQAVTNPRVAADVVRRRWSGA
jgi:glycosyltransferase involved in cell wall biosynthesis